MRISKSRFLQYIQCPKRYWLGVYHPEFADERDMTVFTNGTRVGEYARGLFPDGVLIEYRKDGWLDIDRMLAETKHHIEAGTRILYEAAFATDNLIAICDILVRSEEGYEIYEVKSSGSIKDVYFPDAAFQYHVLNECGINVSKVYITHLNTGYIRQGEIDIDELFFHNDVTSHAKQINEEILEAIPDIEDVYRSLVEPVVSLDLQCETPYNCEFMGYCFRDIKEHSVFELAGISQKLKYELYNKGIIYFNDVMASGIQLKQNLMQQIEAAEAGQPIIQTENIREFMGNLHYPIYFLDFETINPAIPLYEGTSPYEQIPTQYSLHFIEEEGAQLQHREFLAIEGSDPREEIVKCLSADIPEDACVLAYHMAFEKKVIEMLAQTFPDYSEKLQQINEQMHDLIIPFRKRFYYVDKMKGKSSIKSVLPALYPDDPELSYSNLDGIHNGNEASNAYLALTDMNEAEREKTRKSLLEYCRLDTLAMVRIWEKLLTFI
ncbi:MAG: DUF2779 domain-containing protein [Clostridia bacterium]|nr:DUF2779 domain-containing protein [Clostridia bacterium]